jgi:hypothetical protein
MLFDRIEEKYSGTIRQIKIPTKLIVRESVKNLKN